MSYILEALKKSERERAQGKIPTLEIVSRERTGDKSLLLGAVIGAGTLLLIAAIAWFINVKFLSEPATVTSGGTDGSSAGATNSSTDAAVDDEPESALQIRRAGSQPEPAGSSQDAPQRVADIKELAPAARRRIEGLSVNVVSYSDIPERRFVMLNQRIVRESEAVGDGVVVKRITPDGALLSVGDFEILIGPD